VRIRKLCIRNFANRRTNVFLSGLDCDDATFVPSAKTNFVTRKPAVLFEPQEAEVRLHGLGQVRFPHVVDAVDDVDRAKLLEAELLSEVLEPTHVK
jgi:hypothetical protein